VKTHYGLEMGFVMMRTTMLNVIMMEVTVVWMRLISIIVQNVSAMKIHIILKVTVYILGKIKKILSPFSFSYLTNFKKGPNITYDLNFREGGYYKSVHHQCRQQAIAQLLLLFEECF
jgi:hypothetical protein